MMVLGLSTIEFQFKLFTNHIATLIFTLPTMIPAILKLIAELCASIRSNH